MKALLLLVLASACVGTKTMPCPGSDRVCPSGTVCLALASAPEDPLCVRPAQFPPCDDALDSTACDLDADGESDGTCFGGACLPSGCGNLRIDAGEVCDDGANVIGDGCSADCRSVEVCGNGTIDPVTLVGGVSVVNEQCDDGGLLGHDGCSSECSGETTRWTKVGNSEPDPRGQAAMASDTRGARIVLFGGTQPGTTQFARPSRNDSWMWRGGWTRLAVADTPPGRHGHALAYDPERNHTIMFGGSTRFEAFGEEFLGDTWILDGDRWAPVAATLAPVARAGHVMAYHPTIGIVLFGGRSATGDLDDTWIWNGGTWSELAVGSTHPSGRHGHAMAFDPTRGVIVMHGGSAGSQETWEFDGATWTRAAALGPARLGHALAFDPTRGELILFGGRDQGAYLRETWRRSGETWVRIITTSPPAARSFAGLANDPRTGELILFGGLRAPPPMCTSCGESPTNDTWRWNGTAWSQLVRQTPTRITEHAAVLDLERGRIVRFGGRRVSFNGTLLVTEQSNETWEYDGTQWSLGVVGPTARYRTAMAYDATRKVTVLFGGYSDVDGVLGDTWTWDGTSWTPRTVTPAPSPRQGHVMTFDLARGRVVLIGSGTDTWEWDGARWIDVTPAAGSPLGLTDVALAYDPIRRHVVMFGGTAGSDTWVWDGTTWLERHPPSSPSSRSKAGLVWDGNRGQMVLYGGEGSDDSWAWNGTRWTLLPVDASPPRRAGFVAVGAPTGDGLYIFGGYDEEKTLDDVWRLSLDDRDGRYQTCRTLIDEDDDGLAGCAEPDCWSVCTPSCPPGAMCSPLAPRCGDGICNTTLENCRTCSDCPCVARCGDWICDAGETAAVCPGDCP